ncbi:hypothetical protein [Streptomyces lavendulae]|uniref:hypothetical protein n=1 Tax=Streptomyces lavendulae TaxID=1914 RepID=UPI0037FB2D75
MPWSFDPWRRTRAQDTPRRAALGAVLVAAATTAATAGGGPTYAVERCKVSPKTVDNPACKQGST